MDYALPPSDDIPPLTIDHLETPSPLNPLGLKGVGESGTLPMPVVVASAVEDALGGAAGEYAGLSGGAAAVSHAGLAIDLTMEVLLPSTAAT
jgi:hypothetical protein